MRKTIKSFASVLVCLTSLITGTSFSAIGADAAGEYLKITSPIGYVNFRTGNSTSSTKLGTIPTGSTVKHISTDKYGWCLVEYNGQKGYISKVYTKAHTSSQAEDYSENTSNVSLTVKVTASKGVYLRKEANSSSKALCFIPYCTVLKAGETDRYGWTEITYNGISGYIPCYLTKPADQNSTVSPDTGDSTVNTGMNLSFQKAYSYASAFWNKKNPIYNYYVNNNCANYCSQILSNAGLPLSSKWRNGSAAFITVSHLRRYLVSTYGVAYTEYPDKSRIEPGDLVLTDNGGHIMFVMSTANGRILCNGNTNNRHLMSLSPNAICGVIKTSELF